MKLILIFNPKGGVGKSSLNTIIPTALYNKYNYNVITIDGDLPQFNLYKLREREKVIIKQEFKNNPSSYICKKFIEIQQSQKPSYKVLAKDLLDIPATIEEIKKENKYDLMFIDLAGTVNTTGLQSVLKYVDLFIIPMDYDSFELDSSIDFYKDMLPNHANKSFLFNKVEHTDIKDVKVLRKTFDKHNVNYFNVIIPKGKRYKTEFIKNPKLDSLRSTIFYTKDLFLDRFIDELEEKIKKL